MVILHLEQETKKECVWWGLTLSKIDIQVSTVNYVNPNNHFWKLATLPRLLEAFSYDPVKRKLKFPPTQKMEKFEWNSAHTQFLIKFILSLIPRTLFDKPSKLVFLNFSSSNQNQNQSQRRRKIFLKASHDTFLQ